MPWKREIFLSCWIFSLYSSCLSKIAPDKSLDRTACVITAVEYCFPPQDSCYSFLNMHHFDNSSLFCFLLIAQLCQTHGFNPESESSSVRFVMLQPVLYFSVILMVLLVNTLQINAAVTKTSCTSKRFCRIFPRQGL